ncbi:NAD(P)/FAD-dependent oxidoreductase [Pseudomonas sp. MDT2-39-1]
MIVTEPLPLLEVGGVDGNGLYGRQTLRGNLAYGGGPHEWVELADLRGTRPQSTPLQCNIAKRLAELFPKIAHKRVIRSWAGFIENTPDGRPVIDRPAALDNVTVATMSGVGFELSPASGHAIRDLVVDGECSFADLSTFSLSRFCGPRVGLASDPGMAAVAYTRGLERHFCTDVESFCSQPSS